MIAETYDPRTGLVRSRIKYKGPGEFKSLSRKARLKGYLVRAIDEDSDPVADVSEVSGGASGDDPGGPPPLAA
jgi:hypothetical protein